jgi:arsenate reductase (thioredoxin)
VPTWWADEAAGVKKRVLFLCTGNSARSQMAEGLLRHFAADRFEVASAGTHPVGLNPFAVEVMRELNADISRQHSKSVDEFLGQRFDYVVTVCDRAKESCPVFPGTSVMLHWSFKDPAAAAGSDEERRKQFRKVRDQIGKEIEILIKTDGAAGIRPPVS